jgi:peptide deformylase
LIHIKYMILKILSYGNNKLRVSSSDINSDYPKLSELISNMFETMDKAEGVGLAAPQIGENISLFVVDSKFMSNDFPDEELDNFRKVFINPYIEEYFGEDVSFREGCLSLPRISDEVIRPDGILISWYDENFNLHKEKFTGVKSRIIQHEYDHLDGILYIDKLKPIKRKLLESKLKKISKGDVYVKYDMKFS